MSFVVLHADRFTTALADDAIVPASEVDRFRDVGRLLAEVDRLRGSVDEAVAAARAEGFEAGRKEGRAAGESEMRGELFRLALRDGAARRGQQAEIARIALAVVRRIAGEIGAPDMVAALTERATATLAPDTAATIRVAPGALDTVRQRLANRSGLMVESDAALDATECVIETALGQVHAGLDVQLAQIERAWAETPHGD